jgi:urea transport system permease protein
MSAMANGMRRGEALVLGLCAGLILLVLPLLNAIPQRESFWWVSDFTVSVVGKYLCYAILALGVNLLWGFTGMLSLGQALFFSLGGYAFGMHLMLMIGRLGQYQADIPDFMVFLEFPKRFPETGGLPPHWIPFKSFWFALAAVIWVPALVALVFGYLAFRSRIRGVYFSILSQALTYAATLMFFRNDFTLGGNNGLTDFKMLLGWDVNAAGTRRALCVASGVALLGVYLLLRWLSRTKFGLVQRAIRDSENRVLFSGYATGHFKLFVFVLSAAICGIGGALFVPQVGIINPSEMSPEKSLEAVVWCAVGGRSTLAGPILGAIGVNALKTYATRAFAEQWLYILGGLFVLVTLVMPDGMVGIPRALQRLAGRLGWKPKGGSVVEDGVEALEKGGDR